MTSECNLEIPTDRKFSGSAVNVLHALPNIFGCRRRRVNSQKLHISGEKKKKKKALQSFCFITLAVSAASCLIISFIFSVRSTFSFSIFSVSSWCFDSASCNRKIINILSADFAQSLYIPHEYFRNIKNNWNLFSRWKQTSPSFKYCFVQLVRVNILNHYLQCTKGCNSRSR